MSEKLISIIIPTYNVEKYLDRCVNSVINQTYSNIEIVLVDDGSTDNSGVICDKYMKCDQRVKVIHKKNEGVAEARNVGLDNSNGEYVTFVDSDDYVPSDYVEYLYEILSLNKATISCCNFEYIYENSNQTIKSKNNKEIIVTYSNKEALEDLLYQRNIDTSPWGKLYRKEVFKNIRFPIGKIYEDFGTIYKVVSSAEKVVYSNQKKYYYLIRKDSTTGRSFSSKDFDMIELSKNLEKDIVTRYPEMKSAINSRIINMDFYFIRRMRRDEFKEEYDNIVSDIKKRRKNLLKDKKIKLKTRIGIYISYINIRLIKYVYNFAKKIKFFGISKYLTKYKG